MTLLSKVIFCPYIEMGVARLASSGVFWPALESFVLPLSTTYLKTKRADRFADPDYLKIHINGWGAGPGVQLYFCTLILSTFLQNPGRLAQKCTVLRMYEHLEISRTCVLNANY